MGFPVDLLAGFPSKVLVTINISPVLVVNHLSPKKIIFSWTPKNRGHREVKGYGQKFLVQTKDKTLLISLTGTRKVVRTPTIPFEVDVHDSSEVYVPKEIIDRQIQSVGLSLPT